MVLEVFADSESSVPTDGEALDAVHKKLHSRNSATHLFLRQLTLVREVLAENEIVSPTDGEALDARSQKAALP